MAYDETLAQRIRSALAGHPGITEKKMFGGIAFLRKGHMFAGVTDATLMARVGPGNYEAALARAHVREMDFTGRPMRGYVFIDPGGLKSARDLGYWLELCETFVATLPAKPAKAAKAAKRA